MKKSKAKITSEEHANQEVAEKILQLNPFDPEEGALTKQILEEKFQLKGEKLKQAFKKIFESYEDER